MSEWKRKRVKRLGIWAGGFHLSARTWVVGGTIGKCLAQLAQVEIVERAYSRVRESARRVRMAPIRRVEAARGPLERELFVVHSVVVGVGCRIVDWHRDGHWGSRGRAQVARGEHDCGRHRQLATFCRRRCCCCHRRRYYCATASAAATAVVDRLLYRWCHIFLSLSLLS